jgi:restriction system protein
MSVWLNRAGSKGEFEHKFLSEGKIFLTWSIIDKDLREVKDIEELRGWHQDKYQTKTKASLNYAAQIWKFLKMMKIDDIIVLPSKINSTIHFGVVKGDCEYKEDNKDPFKHFRKVEWIKTDVKRTDFDQDLLYSFGAFSTIAKIERNDAEKRVRNFLFGENNKINDNKSNPEELTKIFTEENDIDIEEKLYNKLHSFIDRKFKGYEMQNLVASILEAKGYATLIPPAGADNGIDILAGKGKNDFGFLSPRIVVQVKSSSNPISSEILNQLVGSINQQNADFGILVSWGGFKLSYDKMRITNYFKVRLWDSRELIEELLDNYDNLSEEMKLKIPLKKIWILNNFLED